jgi:hypothetical protein
MPMASHAGGVLDAIAVLRPPPIARARQHGCKLALDQFFDERPHPIAHRALDRIEPTVEKMFFRGGLRLQSRRTNAIADHGRRRFPTPRYCRLAGNCGSSMAGRSPRASMASSPTVRRPTPEPGRCATCGSKRKARVTSANGIVWLCFWPASDIRGSEPSRRRARRALLTQAPPFPWSP